MIVVKVELWSAITGRKTELARMEIANDGEGTLNNTNLGDYDVRTLRGRSTAALDQRVTQRKGKIKGWRRHDFHVWNLVHLALIRMGYFQGHDRVPLQPAEPFVQPDVQLVAGAQG